MQNQTFILQSPFDGLPLHLLVFEPQGEKKGVLQILHGMCEFKERYEPFMRYFAQNGFVVACHDQRGHGDSVKAETDLGYFYDKSGNAIVEDAAFVTQFLKDKYPALPVYLFGHSMGSMIARCYLQTHDNLVDKAIICGSPSKNPLAGVAIALTKVISLFCGARHRSKLLSYLSTGKGDKNFEGEGKGAWLSHNRESIESFYQSPKGKFRFTCNGFENLFKLMKHTYQAKRYEGKNPALPVHFVSGSEDAVMVDELKWFHAIEQLRKVGYERVSGKLYEGQRHEIFHDTKKDEVLADLLAFLQNE